MKFCVKEQAHGMDTLTFIQSISLHSKQHAQKEITHGTNSWRGSCLIQLSKEYVNQRQEWCREGSGAGPMGSGGCSYAGKVVPPTILHPFSRWLSHKLLADQEFGGMGNITVYLFYVYRPVYMPALF